MSASRSPEDVVNVLEGIGDSKVAVVTGASAGIGRATAIALSEKGWKVVLSGRRESELHETALQCRWETLVAPGDITSEEYVKDMFEQTISIFGRLDMLFNNAGMSSGSVVLDETSADLFRSVLDVNVTGAFLCTKKAFEIFRGQGFGGRIINNGSVSAHVPRLHSTAYTVSKHAISGLTKSTALDGRSLNITCTQIDIGNAETSMASRHSAGTLQADGTTREEPMIDPTHVANMVVHIAELPPAVAVLYVNVMATGMPFVGRG